MTKYKSSTESIILKVLTFNVGEMLHKIRKQVSNVATLVTKSYSKKNLTNIKVRPM